MSTIINEAMPVEDPFNLDADSTPMDGVINLVDGVGNEQQNTEEDPIDRIIQGVNVSDLDEDKLDQLIDQHPQVKAAMAPLIGQRKTGTYTREQEQEYRNNIVNTRQEVGSQIKAKFGIIEENPETRERRLEAERLRALGNILVTVTHDEDGDDNKLLTKYGLVDEEGKMTEASMSSPLFKADTRSAFSQYMRYAVQYDALEAAEAIEHHPIKNIGPADIMRKKAHNAVAKFVQRDLGLGLSFDEARRFVQKAREAIVPNSGETTSYAKLLRGQKLAEKFGHDAAAFAHESLRNLIDEPTEQELNR